MLAAPVYARRRRLQWQRRLGILRRNAKKRYIKVFERKPYLENVLFIVLLFVTRVAANSGEMDLYVMQSPYPGS